MDEKLLKDDRFAHVRTDPRFRRAPQKQRKVVIDKRFQSMFTDSKFKLNYTLDKRGRPQSHSTTDDLRKYYDLGSDESEDSDSDESESEEEQDEEEEEKKTAKEAKTEGDVVTPSKQTEDSEEDEGDDDGSDEEKRNEDDFDEEENNKNLNTKYNGDAPLSKAMKKRLRDEDCDYARGAAFVTTDSSSDEETSENESDADVRDMDHNWGELDRDAERTEEATNRLAVCNMDWDRIRAKDLMVLFNSFLPPGGIIHSVTIYPSEFGMERMKSDEVSGPLELLSEKPTEPKNFHEEDDETSEDEETTEEDKFHMERLRRYQLSRLKYFYAVAVFDAPATANKVYADCDGMEYESSASHIDLRFVPDDTTFDQPPKDVCDELPEPKRYDPLTFNTAALQQGKVRLTWDETDPYRVSASNRIAAGTADDEDLRAFLASSSEEDEPEVLPASVMAGAPKVAETEAAADEKARPKKEDFAAKYRALLAGIEKEEKVKEEEETCLEVTWGLDLKAKATDLVKKRLIDGPDKPTPFQEMLQKRIAKKREKREGWLQKKSAEKDGKAAGDDDSEDDVPPDVDLNDPFFKEENLAVSESKKRKDMKKEKIRNRIAAEEHEQTEEAKQKKAELELLLMDDDDDRQHFSLAQILESEKADGKKKKKKWSRMQAVKTAAAAKDNFKIDTKDDRFSALYSSHHFNIDPTDPRFLQTQAMGTLLAEKLKRKQTEEEEAGTAQPKQERLKKVKKSEKSGDIASELGDLVKKLKKKTDARFKC